MLRVDRLIPHPAESLHSLLALAHHEQPSRRLGDSQNTDQEQAGRDKLNGNGNEPLGVTRRHGRVNAVVDPEADEATNLPSKLVDTDQSATDSRGRELGNVDRRHVGATTNAKASEDSSTVYETEAAVAIGSAHETGSKSENEGKEKQRLTTTEEVGRDIGAQAAEEGTGLVDGDDIGPGQGQLFVGERGEVKFIAEGL